MTNPHTTTAINALHLLTDDTETLRRLTCHLIAQKLETGSEVEIPNHARFHSQTTADAIRADLTYRGITAPTLRETAAQLVAERWRSGENVEVPISPGLSILMKPERVQE